MTEVEWLTIPIRSQASIYFSLSPRKLRLYSVACLRALGHFVKPPIIAEALDAIEHFADSGRSKAALRRHRQALTEFRQSAPAGGNLAVTWCVRIAASENAVVGTSDQIERLGAAYGNIDHLFRRRHFHLLADIGNPFRPVAFAPAWRTETAVALAAGIYEERAFDRLSILADALEEAGCDHPDVLSHCRGHGPHARGCWVVDGVLEKE